MFICIQTEFLSFIKMFINSNNSNNITLFYVKNICCFTLTLCGKFLWSVFSRIRTEQKYGPEKTLNGKLHFLCCGRPEHGLQHG